MSISPCFSKKATSAALSVDFVSVMACASILRVTYSIQAWFSGGLPCFLVKVATNAFDPGVSMSWCQTVGQVPLRLFSPAAQASAVLRLKPTIG
jgi:hypothetical protein